MSCFVYNLVNWYLWFLRILILMNENFSLVILEK